MKRHWWGDHLSSRPQGYDRFKFTIPDNFERLVLYSAPVHMLLGSVFSFRSISSQYLCIYRLMFYREVSVALGSAEVVTTRRRSHWIRV